MSRCRYPRCERRGVEMNCNGSEKLKAKAYCSVDVRSLFSSRVWALSYEALKLDNNKLYPDLQWREAWIGD